MAARLAMLALAFGLLAPAAYATGPVTTVPRADSYKVHRITVNTGGAPITTADFATVIMDCDKYPLTATYAGVKALEKCKTLDHLSDGSVVIVQRTGGNFLVSSRHYVLQLKVVSQTDDRVEIQWDLVQHSQTDETFSGPYAAALNADPDAVYTPYNVGGWIYDKKAGNITYWVTTDAGGNIPAAMQTEGAIMAFPKELLKVRWGVIAD